MGTHFVAALLSASCGGSLIQPTITTSVAVALPSVLKVGDAAQATAVATLNNGDAKPLSIGWRSDAPGVAAVTNAGLVTGVTNGVANISVTSGGVQGTKSLRVVPNYHGRWTGAYQVDRCTPLPTPAYDTFCSGYQPGTVILLTMTFAQNGDVINGQFIAGGLVSSGFASALNGDGSAEVRASNITFPYQYGFTWRLAVPTPGKIDGTVLLARSGSGGLVGGANIEGTILFLTQ